MPNAAATPTPATTGRRVLFACDLDSQIFGALPIAEAFAARGWTAVFAIDRTKTKAIPETLVERLGRRFEVIERQLGSLPTSQELFDYSAVGVFATGSQLALFRHMAELSAKATGRPRPALFCGFNGLVFEKFEEGVAWRLGYDVVALNGPRDRDAFDDFLQGSEFSGQSAVVVGLKRNPRPQETASRREGGGKLFVFAEQVVVPRWPLERKNLIETLARLARENPGWEVAVKARVKPKEQTFHEQPAPVERLVERLKDRPSNLVLTYEPLEHLLPRASLFATISSTALFDALDHGVPSFVAADFGLRNADGAHVFFSSGLRLRLADLSSLDDAPRLTPEPRWLERVGYGAGASPDALIDWIDAFDPASPLPPAFHALDAAARSASDTLGEATAITEAFADVERKIAAGGDAAGERDRLGRLVASAVSAAGGKFRADDGPLAALSRRLGVYWAYKRARAAAGFPVE